MRLYTCSQPELFEAAGIAAGRCIDPGWIAARTGRSVPDGRDPCQRGRCGCASSKDIGAYDTCLFGCAYCYATSSFARARAAFARHGLEDGRAGVGVDGHGQGVGVGRQHRSIRTGGRQHQEGIHAFDLDQGHAHVLQGGKVVEQVEILKDHTDILTQGQKLFPGCAIDFPALEEDASRIRRGEKVDAGKQGGFARARGTDQHLEVAFADRQGDIVEDAVAANGLDDVFHAQDGRIIHGQGPGDGHALLLAPRQLGREDVGLLQDADLGEQVHGRLFGFGLACALELHRGHGPIERLAAVTRLSRILWTIITYLVFLAVVLVLLSSIVPRLGAESSAFLKRVPDTLEKLRAHLDEWAWLVPDMANSGGSKPTLAISAARLRTV